MEIVEGLVHDRFYFHDLAFEFFDLQLLLNCDWSISVMYISRDAKKKTINYLARIGASSQRSLTRLEAPPQQSYYIYKDKIVIFLKESY